MIKLPDKEECMNDESIQKKSKTFLWKGLFIAVFSSVMTLIIALTAVLFWIMPVVRQKALDQYLQDEYGQSFLEFDANESTIQAVNKLREMVSLLRDNYYQELTDEQIVLALAEGLPASLDNPYTYYLTAEQYETIYESMSANYVGIGCSVSQNLEGVVQVMEVYSDSPAEKMGLMPGDMFIAVDGVDVSAMKDTNELASLVKGEENTEVVIQIFREATDQKLTFTITRKLINNQFVRYEMLDSDTGYIHIRSFANSADNDFIEGMNQLQENGAENVIIDLRYNSGGSADVMRAILEYLLPPNTLLATIKGRNQGQEYTIDWSTEKIAYVPDDMKFAILTNEYSASASEFFSGCLRDHGKAIIVGKTTFGKGSGTITYRMNDQSAITITVFRYYLPSGELIEGKGIDPTFDVDLPEEYQYTSIEMIPEGFDTVLEKAQEELDKNGGL